MSVKIFSSKVDDVSNFILMRFIHLDLFHLKEFKNCHCMSDREKFSWQDLL